MDNKVTKKRIVEHLEYDWFKYLLILAASIALFVAVFVLINRTRDVEDIRVFASAYSKKEYDFSSKAVSALKEEGDSRILDVDMTFYDVRDSSYLIQLQSNGVLNSDILILGENVIKQFGSGLLVLSDEVLQLMLPQDFAAQYYADASGNVRGIRVDTLKSVGSALVFDYTGEKPPDAQEDDFTYDEKFYLAINSKSKNIGRFAAKGGDNYQTFSVAKTFFTCFS